MNRHSPTLPSASFNESDLMMNKAEKLSCWEDKMISFGKNMLISLWFYIKPFFLVGVTVWDSRVPHLLGVHCGDYILSMGEMCKGETFLPVCHWKEKACRYDCLHTYPPAPQRVLWTSEISPFNLIFSKKGIDSTNLHRGSIINIDLLGAVRIQKYKRGVFAFEKLQKMIYMH